MALTLLCLAWELALAPLRPGGSTLVLKAVPLLLAVRGVVAGRVYTYQWSMMLVLAYFAEGCVRAWSDAPPSSTLAAVEIALSAAFFASAIAYVRAARRRSAPVS